jgi:hypothetical protein
MKLEFLESGSRDCPLIRLYEFGTKEANILRRIALHLAGTREQTVLFHEQPGVIPVDGCHLTLHLGEKDLGVSELGSNKFKWVLSKAGWFQVAGLIRPFTRIDSSGFQWLSDGDQIRVLLSHNGSW